MLRFKSAQTVLIKNLNIIFIESLPFIVSSIKKGSVNRIKNFKINMIISKVWILTVLISNGVYSQTFADVVAPYIAGLVKQFNLIDESTHDVVILRMENERFSSEGDDLVDRLYEELKMENFISILANYKFGSSRKHLSRKATFMILISSFDNINVR